MSQESGEREQRHFVTEEQQGRIWELHLRGVPKQRIAREVELHRMTVARVIAACYRELAKDGKVKPAEKLAAAVARIRRIQEQAWSDHDAAKDDRGQRSQHLRIALDAEKEIARLEGLYEATGDESDVVVLRIERRSGERPVPLAGAGEGQSGGDF